ncbi:hypothetical protein BD413DRAFT_468701 [Trametes elegans]|nr:hypothetical protein BD413DRAFT_468701 [Trametes elegans]
MANSSSFSLPKAELIALAIEGLVFGALTVLYAISVWVFMYRKRAGRSTSSKWMFMTVTSLFVLALVHFGINIQRAIDGFVNHAHTSAETTHFYGQLNNPLHVTKSMLFCTQTVVGDSFVIYRLYVIWDRRKAIIILPVLLLVGTAVSGYAAGIQFALGTGGSRTVFEDDVRPWITSLLSLSLATNVLVTVLIVGRVLWYRNKARPYRTGDSAATYRGAFELIIQSAAVYSAALVSLIITYAAGSNAQTICLDALQPLIGGVLCLIIVRVGLARNLSEDELGSQRTRTHPPPSRAESYVDTGSANDGRTFHLRPMKINVSVVKTRDASSASFEYFDVPEGTSSVVMVKESFDADVERGTCLESRD